jgi:hypothetical protein
MARALAFGLGYIWVANVVAEISFEQLEPRSKLLTEQEAFTLADYFKHK